MTTLPSQPIERTIRLRCAPDHAFDVFTSRVDLWWPPSHRRYAESHITLEPRVGGRFFERSPAGDETRLGEVLRCEPPHRLTYSWYPGGGTGPTEVDVRFTRDGEETVVDVSHAEGPSGLGEQWTARARGFGRAWDEVLPALARHLQGE